MGDIGDIRVSLILKSISCKVEINANFKDQLVYSYISEAVRNRQGIETKWTQISQYWF